MASKYPVPAHVRRDLRRVEARLAEVAAEAEAPLRAACDSTLKAGGKRLRPALVLVCGTTGKYDLARLMPHAVAVELVHMASLVHDDILDDAPMRRGLPSVHARWGTTIGVAAGDFLFSKAFEVLASSGLEGAPEVLAETSLDLTEGELMQRAGKDRVDVRRDEYLARVRAKTASLFRTSCLLGALASRAPEQVVTQLAAYGEQLGMAFQIFDDVLDVAGTSDTLGKAVGADVRDGTMTLPMMLAVEELGDDAWLRRALGRSDGEKAAADALAKIASTSACTRARGVARSYVGAAVAAISSLESTKLRATLTDIGNYVIARYD